MLKLADIVAHALYKTVHRSPRDYALSEFSYLKDLSEKFYSHDKTGNILNYGIKPIHYLSQLNLDMSSVDEFKNMKTAPRPLPRDTVSTNDGVV